jgi:hypothetical protein
MHVCDYQRFFVLLNIFMNKTPQRTPSRFYFNDLSDLGISEDDIFVVFPSNYFSIKFITLLNFFEMIKIYLSFFL